MRPFNGTTPFSTDYRGLLVAKVTAKHTPSTGPLAGRFVYEWTEQQIGATGEDEDAPSARKGTYTSATDFDNVLLDSNDSDILPGTYVWARMKGAVQGATVYETVVSTSPAPDQPADYDCQRAFAGIRTTECVRLYSDGGNGVNPFDITATWSAGPSGWVGDDTITTGDGSTTVTLVRGLGYYYLKFVGATTTWYGELVGCDGGARVFAADGNPTSAEANCADHTFLTYAECVACADACQGWYCLPNLGTVAYAEDCDAENVLDALNTAAGLGSEANCSTTSTASLPNVLTVRLYTSSPVAAQGVNGWVGPMNRQPNPNYWQTPNAWQPGFMVFYTPPYGAIYPALVLEGCVSPSGLYRLRTTDIGTGGCTPPLAIEWRNPIASSPTPWTLVFEIPVCTFYGLGPNPLPPANANDMVTVVISED